MFFRNRICVAQMLNFEVTVDVEEFPLSMLHVIEDSHVCNTSLFKGTSHFLWIALDDSIGLE